ncbi:bifunctional 3-(3-hydroxy-phenyl)propionate/3-hydroxycinnamic acid hydroxylase [Sphingomonas sp.]|uniref:bifunctional 3-(3-hydroxy-phenyl)propionate/3-hydroxycinnamic acid hydroxylase MhpA n=1 Tax=Sphingomonas sp. TaxID=28214 RepID=UPI0017C080C1|nr:bifunctional 3-(3-hydroxy-phenyl)propionate/3-hydroxycinnamic acid hydroxylase [Sphingomonas sp.]MBA4761834.1 bifunctional 3-(3-hydroxy-phenyl)propionate/3-hydroxycinnamic acid hydroxylase [Sphingomonas sp.]
MTGRFDVVIVGLGPVGAVLAALLGQDGLQVLVLERSREVYPLPRAAHFDHEIMRVFQRAGIADAALGHSRVAGAYEFRNAAGDVLMTARRGDEQGASGWAYSYMFNQPGVEHALRDRLAQMPNVTVRLGESFSALYMHAEHVLVESAADDGGRSSFETRFLVGCDGAWSPVREALGIGLEDYQFDEPWLVVDTIPSDPTQLPTLNLQICDPARPTTCVLMGPGRHRWEFMLLPGETPEAVLAPGFAESLLDSWNVDVEIERRAVYRFHGLIAHRWRDGRVLIAGDAAHQMPPFAGQGMCSGIRDAANLAWKLGMVVKQGVSTRLLDSYQAERERSVRDYIELAIEMGRVVCTLDPQRAAERDAAMLANRSADPSPPPQVGGPGLAGGVFMTDDPLAGAIFPQPVSEDGGRLDDALDHRAWLIDRKGGAGTADLNHVATSDPVLAPFADALNQWLTEHGVEAVLVRPDRYVFGAGAADSLLTEWHAQIQVAAPLQSVA